MSGLVTTTWPADRMFVRIGAGRVAVVDAGCDVDLGGGGQLAERGQLVLAQRLGREEVQRASGGILGHRLEDRQVVAQRLARRGRRDDDDVLAGAQRLERLRLVGVEHLDARAMQGTDEALVQPRGELGTVCAARSGRTRCSTSASLDFAAPRAGDRASRWFRRACRCAWRCLPALGHLDQTFDLVAQHSSAGKPFIASRVMRRRAGLTRGIRGT